MVDGWFDAIYDKLESIVVAESLATDNCSYIVFVDNFSMRLELIRKRLVSNVVHSSEVVLNISIYRNRLDNLVARIVDRKNGYSMVNEFHELEEVIEEIDNRYREGWRIDGKIC